MQSCHLVSTDVLALTWPFPYANGVELTATQLLNSGWRSPNDARTAGVRARTRHRKEISLTGGAKSRRCILHVQCCLYYFSVLREAKTQRLLHTCRGTTGGKSARAVCVGKALACNSSFFSGLAYQFNTRCCDGPHMLSTSAIDEAMI